MRKRVDFHIDTENKKLRASGYFIMVNNKKYIYVEESKDGKN